MPHLEQDRCTATRAIVSIASIASIAIGRCYNTDLSRRLSQKLNTSLLFSEIFNFSQLAVLPPFAFHLLSRHRHSSSCFANQKFLPLLVFLVIVTSTSTPLAH